MKFTHDWLCEYCPVEEAPEKLAERLTRIGVKVEELHGTGPDAVYVLEVTANRPDYLSILGVAREAALLTGKPVMPPPIDVPAQRVERIDRVPVEVEDPALCPRYTARLITGISVAPSPPWLTKRIEAIGLRPVNNVVDVTNYVLYETGQPLHAFDLDRLSGPRIVVRRALDGETMRAIDDREYRLTADNLVIADERHPVAIAGIMGGKATEVTESTRAILIESAIFDPGSVRRTGRRLGLRSDSSYRFERGIDPAGTERASRRAADLIRRLAGGEVLATYVDLCARSWTPVNVRLRYARVAKTLGYDVPHAEVRRILAGLGLSVVNESDAELLLAVPSHRPDVELEADLVEEVARVWGYDRIPETPSMRIALVGRHRQGEVEEAVRDYLCGAGCQEVLTSSIVDERQGLDFPHASTRPQLGLLNPEGKVDRWLRNSILPGLLGVQRTNEGYGLSEVRAFEIARAYWRAPQDDSVREGTRLAVLDSRGLAHLKGVWEGLLARLRMEGSATAAEAPGLRRTRSLWLTVGGRSAGVMGECDAEVAKRYDLRTAPAVLEIDMAPIVEAARLSVAFRDFSTYPAIERDLAVAVEDTLAWERLASTARAAGPANLESIRPFDLYRGKGVGEGKKSVAFRMVFRAGDRTLTGAEVDAEVAKVAAALAALGATVRG